MIGLIAAGRGGGGGETPTFYTVPWSPGIAARTGQIPGVAYRTMMILVDVLRASGLVDRMSEVDLFDTIRCVLQGAPICQALIAGHAIALAAELEIVPQRRRG